MLAESIQFYLVFAGIVDHHQAILLIADVGSVHVTAACVVILNQPVQIIPTHRSCLVCRMDRYVDSDMTPRWTAD